LQLGATQIVVHATTTGTVTLNGPAPAGGTSVGLTSLKPTIASVPASLIIPANATSGTFTITGLAPGSSTITATCITAVSALIAVVAPKEGILDNPSKIIRDGTAQSLPIRSAGSLGPAGPTAAASKIADGATSIGIVALTGAASQTAAQARSFIRPDERPVVDEYVLNAARVE
jgi:hypothetical protein